MIYWANQHTALVAGIWWWIFFPVLLVVMTFIGLFLLAVSMNEYIDPRSRLGAWERADERRPRRRRACAPTTGRHALRRRRATCAPSTASASRSRRNEIYGLAGESSSGKTTLIKTIAAATQPPLEVVGGHRHLQFPDRRDRASTRADRRELAPIRWRHLSYIMQGSMSVLNPVRRVRHAFVDFAFRHIGQPSRSSSTRCAAHLRACSSSPTCSTPIRTSSRAACASASPSRSRPSAGPNSSSPTSRPPRSTWWCRRTCWR